jgi:hypothetical protein
MTFCFKDNWDERRPKTRQRHAPRLGSVGGGVGGGGISGGGGGICGIMNCGIWIGGWMVVWDGG